MSGREAAGLGVIGAGTMGSGIALVGLLAGQRVILVEPVDAMRDRAREYLHRHLEKKGVGERLRDLVLAADLDSLRGARVVIEAVPEDLDLKQGIFRQLDVVCAAPAVLATNTSTLSVSAIAAAAGSPERVAGLHFFNPAPVLPLVEVVRAQQTDDRTLQTLLDLAKALQKTPIVTQDTPGFVVNRVARPFYGEALRLLAEGAAPAAEIDRLVEVSGGFRLGPFRLMDLIGIDVNFAATRSMFEQTFGEPRYRPHWMQQRMVREGRLGRKSGRGFYEYPEGGTGATSAAPELPIGPAQGKVFLSSGAWGPGVAELVARAGYTPVPAGEAATSGWVLAGRNEGAMDVAAAMDRSLPPDAPLFCQCSDVSLSEYGASVSRAERLVGFDGLFFSNGASATLVRTAGQTEPVRRVAEAVARALGREPVWVEDVPGLVLPRIVSMLANEASFAVAEGVADAETIDLAMRLGTNYPHGPLEWAAAIGWGKILAVLEHLQRETGEERYRPSTWLRRNARAEGHPAGP